MKTLITLLFIIAIVGCNEKPDEPYYQEYGRQMYNLGYDAGFETAKEFLKNQGRIVTNIDTDSFKTGHIVVLYELNLATIGMAYSKDFYDSKINLVGVVVKSDSINGEIVIF